MKSYIKYMAVAFFAGCAAIANAQDLRTGYFSDNFLYRHDLNPAIANDSNYFSIPVVGNVNAAMMGNFGYSDLVHKNPLYPDESDKKMTSFMNPYVKNPLKGFASGDNKVNGEMKVSIMSVGFKKWKGYNTVELNLRGQANVRVPFRLFQLATEAANDQYNIGDINASAQAFTELSFGHSRQYDRKLRVGAKVKLLVGFGDVNVKMENVKAELNHTDYWTVNGNAESHVSMKGFNYVSKIKEYNASPGTYPHVRDIDMGKVGIAGFGAAIDAGAVYKINDDLTVSGAVRDLGAIMWSNDYYATNDSETLTFDGFHDVTIGSDSPNVLDRQADSYTDQMLDFANLRDKGDKGSRITGLGATVLAGGEYIIPTYRILKVGLLGTARINGPYSWGEVRLSGNISPVKWFDGSVSLAVNNYTANFGFLANVHTKGFNFFVGMDSLLGKVSKEMIPLSSNGGVSFGFNVIL